MCTLKRHAVMAVLTLLFHTTTVVDAAPGKKATEEALQAEIADRTAGDEALQNSIDNIIHTPDRTSDLCALYQSLSNQGLIGNLEVPAYCPPAHVNIVFKTSTRYVGYDLGGLSGADDKCQQRALAAGLSGTYKAWFVRQ